MKRNLFVLFVILIVFSLFSFAKEVTYEVTFAFTMKAPEKYIWMPLPSVSDGVGVVKMGKVTLLPSEGNLQKDSNGNYMAYWVNTRGWTIFRASFEITLDFPTYKTIDESAILPYNPADQSYKENTRANLMIQSNHPEIINLAQEIAGNEPNYYQKIINVANWVHDNVSPYSTGPQDALNVFYRKGGTNEGRTFLFCALCRALSIPARQVSVLYGQSISSTALTNLRSGDYTKKTLSSDVIAEYFLSGIGWIQADISRREYSGITNESLFLAKNEVKVGSRLQFTFNIPYIGRERDNLRPGNTNNENFSIEITRK